MPMTKAEEVDQVRKELWGGEITAETALQRLQMLGIADIGARQIVANWVNDRPVHGQGSTGRNPFLLLLLPLAALVLWILTNWVRGR